MDTTEDENVAMLLSMGFPSVEQVRRALQMSKNDINEAVNLLTSEGSLTSYSTFDDLTGMDVSVQTTSPYQEKEEEEEDDAFPMGYLYKLESTVFTEQWSIPYRRNEPLGKCLIAAARLVRNGQYEADEHCQRFVQRCLPEVFRKLLTASAVRNWNASIQQGVYDMLVLYLELIVSLLRAGAVPCSLMNAVLPLAFDMDVEYHQKNKNQDWDETGWETQLSIELFAKPLSSGPFQEPYGKLVDLINCFGALGGFQLLGEMFQQSDDLTCEDMGALLGPLGICAPFLVLSTIKPILSPCLKVALERLHSLPAKELKEKNGGHALQLVNSLKQLVNILEPEQEEAVNTLRLEIILRMLRTPNFSSRIIALKELLRVMEESEVTGPAVRVSQPIDRASLLLWMEENQILHLVLEGNTDQVQYMEKVKNVVEYMGPDLREDELQRMWKLQDAGNSHTVENLHAVLAGAVSRLSPKHIQCLTSLIHKSWTTGEDRARERLITLIGRMGREVKESQPMEEFLQLLWSLALDQLLPPSLVDLALQEHQAIVQEASNREQLSKTYVAKSVDEIQDGKHVVPALKHLGHMAHCIVHGNSSYFKPNKSALSELSQTHGLIRLITDSVKTVAGLKDSQEPKYSIQETVETHLNVLEFLVKEGDLYIPWSSIEDLWDSLATLKLPIFDVFLDWLSRCRPDLEAETCKKLFTEKLLYLDPTSITSAAFNCLHKYMEHINTCSKKIRSSGSIMVVENTEVEGKDFLWQIALESLSEEIAASAMNLLLSFSFLSLSPRLKKDAATLHRNFMAQCYTKLEANFKGNVGNMGTVRVAVDSATRTLTALAVGGDSPSGVGARSRSIQRILRVLQLAERYILAVEESHAGPRRFLSHGASFLGHPVTLNVTCSSSSKESTFQSHSNESMWILRSRLESFLGESVLQLWINDQFVGEKDSQRVLKHMGDVEKPLSVRVTTSSVHVTEISPHKDRDEATSTTTPTRKDVFLWEEEKTLPGVIMAASTNTFQLLFQLAQSLDDPKVTENVRRLLYLLPTDPKVSEQLDLLGHSPGAATADPQLSPRSPRRGKLTPREREEQEKTLKQCMEAPSNLELLYRLEVLSGRLLPVSVDMGSLQRASLFREEFLSAGGFSLILSFLQQESLSQDALLICLQLARYLLCGSLGPWTERPRKRSSVVRSLDFSPSIDNREVPCSPVLGKPTPPKKSALGASAHILLQRLGGLEEGELVGSLVRVSWGAAGGGMRKASGDAGSFASSRSRQSSTGSTASSGSDSGELASNSFSSPTASMTRDRSRNISFLDSLIAAESLEILVSLLLTKTSLLGTFFGLSHVREYLIEMVLGSPSERVRSATCAELERLSLCPHPPPQVPAPKLFLIQTLLKAHVPLWVPSGSGRGTSQRLLSQCSQYFSLACFLLQKLSKTEQEICGISACQMLEDEEAWLRNFVGGDSVTVPDNTVLAGHIKLISALFTCEGVTKNHFSKRLVPELLTRYLFPASSKISPQGSSLPVSQGRATFSPLCYTFEAREAAFKLLLNLVEGDTHALQLCIRRLLSMHHKLDPDLAREYEHEPAVEGRSACNMVGLKNGGATCYMNSVLQQLYLIPGLPNLLLAVDSENLGHNNILYLLQVVFSHLQESQLKFFSPESLWKSFRLWGEPINPREQQDAFEFLTQIVDQTDEELKRMGRMQVFQHVFKGTFSDMKLCYDCDHSYEREETFLALNLPVRSRSLTDSLSQFVKGEVLEGSNAYFCEKCETKRRAMKKTCIKTLPRVLVIQLKRFSYDFDAGRAIKFDDYFQFPWVLDMAPYMLDENEMEEVRCRTKRPSGSSRSEDSDFSPRHGRTNHTYELVGVTVHSGQANAGHYYSFIKDRRRDVPGNPTNGKWMKFNDTSVEFVEMNDAFLEAECFGGTYKAKTDASSVFPDTRLRYWNAYLLFYERLVPDDLPRTPRISFGRSRSFHVSSSGGKKAPSRRESDSLAELSELLQDGEKKGLFMDPMPAGIRQQVAEENLRFFRNREVFQESYFHFLLDLCYVAVDRSSDSDLEMVGECIVTLSLAFLCNTYLRLKSKVGLVIKKWVELLHRLLSRCPEATEALQFQLSSSNHLQSLLLECPDRDVRQAVANILEASFAPMLAGKHEKELVRRLLSFLKKEVGDNIKTCSQYFELLHRHVEMAPRICEMYYEEDAFRHLLLFLLGPEWRPALEPSSDAENISSMEKGESGSTGMGGGPSVRHWSPSQMREISSLHCTLALLVLSCDVSALGRSRQGECEGSSRVCRPSGGGEGEEGTGMPEIVSQVLVRNDSLTVAFLHEMVSIAREVPSTAMLVGKLLVTLGRCQPRLSRLVLAEILNQYSSSPCNELKHLSEILHMLLGVEDEMQSDRLQWIVDGFSEPDSGVEVNGLLAVIQSYHANDSRRSYQALKFLVSLCGKLPLAREQLSQLPSSTRWQWAVGWLRRKMADHEQWTAEVDTSNEDTSVSLAFQRTMSAQDTLAEANALFTEFEVGEMEIEEEEGP